MSEWRISVGKITGEVVTRGRKILSAELEGLINIPDQFGWAFPPSDQAYLTGLVFDYDMNEIYRISSEEIIWIEGWTNDKFETAIISGLENSRTGKKIDVQGLIVFEPDARAGGGHQHPVSLPSKPQPGEERGGKSKPDEERGGFIPVNAKQNTKTASSGGFPWLALMVAALAVFVATD